jgi:O-antigen ligase
MDEHFAKLFLPAAVVACSLIGVYIAVFRSGYLNSDYLGALIFFWVLLAALWNYRQRFLLLLMLVFLWAGTEIPLNGIWTSGRWFVLAIGAMAGVVAYMKDRQHYFGAFHLVAGFCVLMALVSAIVSTYQEIAILKSLSLFLLFLYAASGGRLAFLNREKRFFQGLLLVVELTVYIAAVSYFVFGFGLFGNPNSLGAVMGVVGAPLLLWGILTSGKASRRRRIFAFALCLLLLFFSQARAGILAGIVVCFLACWTLHRYRLLIQGSAMGLLLAIIAIVVTPAQPGQIDMPVRPVDSSLMSLFLYKGKTESGVLSSRKSPWDDTISVIQEHPWFGSGFGTTIGNDVGNVRVGMYSSSSVTGREHGNSYLAITESVGLLGLIPFLTLVLLLLINLRRVLAWLRRTQDPYQFAVPVALVLTAGLIDAFFEDWLFAVGYYLCVFFWVLAFLLMDIIDSTLPSVPRLVADRTHERFTTNLRPVAH